MKNADTKLRNLCLKCKIPVSTLKIGASRLQKADYFSINEGKGLL